MIYTEKEAIEKANLLCKKLGKNWKPNIWFNLLWCYSAKKNNVDVHEHIYFDTDKIRYSAFYRPHSVVVGISNVSPIDAVNDLKEKYKEVCNKYNNHLSNLEKI